MNASARIKLAERLRRIAADEKRSEELVREFRVMLEIANKAEGKEPEKSYCDDCGRRFNCIWFNNRDVYWWCGAQKIEGCLAIKDEVPVWRGRFTQKYLKG